MEFRIGQYKRTVLKRSDEIEIAEITWEPGDRTKKHNHKDSNAWIAVLQGRIFEIRGGVKRYFEPGSDLKLEVPVGVAHIVGNDTNTPAISVHIFMPKLEMEYFEDDESDIAALAGTMTLVPA